MMKIWNYNNIDPLKVEWWKVGKECWPFKGWTVKSQNMNNNPFKDEWGFILYQPIRGYAKREILLFINPLKIGQWKWNHAIIA